MSDGVRNRRLVWAAGIAGALILLWTLRYPVLLFFASYIIAAAILPTIDALAKRLPRILAILAVYLGLFIIVGGALYLAGLPLANELKDFSSKLPELMSRISSLPLMRSFDVDFTALATGLQQGAVSAGVITASFLVGFFAVVVASIYMLYDWHPAQDKLAEILADDHAAIARRIFRRSEEIAGSWVRGQLLLSFIVGVLVFLALSLAGIPYAPVLGVIAALLELVPYAGPVLAAVPAVLLALTVSFTEALAVIGIYFLIQQAENHILTPLIMKNAVHLHPVVVIFAIITGFEALGIPGAVFAVPAASVAWESFKIVNAGRRGA